MAYYMFMDDMQIPIPPESIETTIPSRNETIDLLSAGEVNVIRSAGLTEISFDFMLPNSSYPFDESLLLRGRGAAYYVNKLEQLKARGRPFQFIIVRMKPNGSMLPMHNVKVTLEEYALKDDVEEGFDMMASVKLKQYKDWGAKKLEVKTDEQGNTTGEVKTTRSTNGKEVNNTATVKQGNTLQEIVKREFGNTNNLFAIAALNKVAVPAVLAAGQLMRLKKG